MICPVPSPLPAAEIRTMSPAGRVAYYFGRALAELEAGYPEYGRGLCNTALFVAAHDRDLYAHGLALLLEIQHRAATHP